MQHGSDVKKCGLCREDEFNLKWASLSLSPFLEVISQTAVDKFFSSSLLPVSAADKEVVSAADVALPVVAVVVVAPRSPLALLSVSPVVVVIPGYSPAKLVRSAASADAAMQPRAVPDSTCMSVRLSLSATTSCHFSLSH